MPYLHQVIAAEKGNKALAETELARLSSVLSRPQVMEGRLVTYQPKFEPPHEYSDKEPDKVQRVQFTARQVLSDARRLLSEQFNIVASKEYGNLTARADVVVGGTPVLTQVPATALLYLEKRLEMLRAFIHQVPLLDTTDEWTYDAEREFSVSAPSVTVRTAKTPTAFELAPGTQWHPAQMQRIDKDLTIGTVTTVKYSGAMKRTEQIKLLHRVETLKAAVHAALEEANRVEVAQVEIAKPIMQYIFG